jgi:hypothetical protein
VALDCGPAINSGYFSVRSTPPGDQVTMPHESCLP